MPTWKLSFQVGISARACGFNLLDCRQGELKSIAVSSNHLILQVIIELNDSYFAKAKIESWTRIATAQSA